MNRLTKEFIVNLLKKQSTFDEVNGCFLWQGETNQDGYGQIWAEGKRYTVHRLIAHFFHELNLDDKTQLACHIPTCLNKNCWRPMHIYVGTRSSNNEDTYIAGRVHHNSKKTHCRYGHEYTEENTRILNSGSRTCIQCEKDRTKQRDWTKGENRGKKK